MGHHAEITDTEKRRTAVRIEGEVEIDGSVDGVPDGLDGEVEEFHFNVDYETYRDNEVVDRHVRTWARKAVQKAVEDHEPTENPTGRTVQVE